MNNLEWHVLQMQIAPVYPSMIVDCVEWVDVNAQQAAFILKCKKSDAQVALVAKLETITTYVIENGTMDVQNDVEYHIESLEAKEHTRCQIFNWHEVCAADGAVIGLTDDQIYRLNEKIDEFVTDEFYKLTPDQKAELIVI